MNLLVRVKEQKGAMPFPRRLTRTEIERFWMKLQADVAKCREVMPNKTTFDRCFGELMYDSFDKAQKYYRVFKNSICRGEEPKIPEEFLKPKPLGKTVDDEIILTAGRLYSNEQWSKQKGYIITEKDRFSLENIVNWVNEVREIQLSKEEVKASIKRAWKNIRTIKKEPLFNDKDKLYSPVGEFGFSEIPKERLEDIIGEKLTNI
jgi:hypothetical protein